MNTLICIIKYNNFQMKKLIIATELSKVGIEIMFLNLLKTTPGPFLWCHFRQGRYVGLFTRYEWTFSVVKSTVHKQKLRKIYLLMKPVIKGSQVDAFCIRPYCAVTLKSNFAI